MCHSPKVDDGVERFSSSKHWPSGPMLSISRNVNIFVCLFVGSLLRYRLTVFLPPLAEVRCPRDSESLGKSNGKKQSQI